MRLGVANGVIDLTTGRLLPADRGDLITRCSEVACDPSATAPTFDRFIADISNGDTELSSYLQSALGYSLTGSIKEQYLFYLFGPGGNGRRRYSRRSVTSWGRIARTQPQISSL